MQTFRWDNEAMTELPKPPSGLRALGRAFWDEIVAEFVPSPRELQILRTAARCVDEIDRLERELRRQPLMVEGYAGQPAQIPCTRPCRSTESCFGSSWTA